MQPVHREKRPLTPPPPAPVNSPPTPTPQLSAEQTEQIRRARATAVLRLAAAARRHGMALPEAPPGWVQEERPPLPVNFSDEFQLPEHNGQRLLTVLHQHPRDHRVRFVAEGHRYYIDGVEARISVTTLVHRYCHEFIADHVIDR